MKNIIALILTLCLLLCSAAFAETADAEVPADSLLPFVDISWDMSIEAVAEKTGSFALEDSIVSSVTINEMDYAVVYSYEEGKLDHITVFTDSIGNEKYKDSCSDVYEELLVYLREFYGAAGAKESSNDKWADEASKTTYAGNMNHAVYAGKLSRSASFINDEVDVFTMLTVTNNNAMNIGFIVERAEPDLGCWILKAYTDEFDMPTGRYFIVSDAFTGKFSNSATTNSELTALVFYQDFSDTHEEFAMIRMLEYGKYRVKNSYSKTEYYDVAVMDCDGQKYYLDGYIPSDAEGVRLTDSDAQTLKSILMKGGTVRFAISESDNSLNKYSFVINNASGFDEAYAAWTK